MALEPSGLWSNNVTAHILARSVERRKVHAPDRCEILIIFRVFERQTPRVILAIQYHLFVHKAHRVYCHM